MARRIRFAFSEPPVPRELKQDILDIAHPLQQAEDLSPLLHRIHEARFVLLGEATHGSSEFYSWRAKLRKRLILEKDFSFVAVEGDWPDCYRINRYVKGYPDSGRNAHEILESFSRWPTWMWANEEVADFIEWLRLFNTTVPNEKKVGFYGLDVYSLWDSLTVIHNFLQKHYPALRAEAERAMQCFESYGRDVYEYARATSLVPSSCEKEVINLLTRLQAGKEELATDHQEAYFNLVQNALVLKNAEAYYRTMIKGGPESWNIRDQHMSSTLENIAKYYGPQSKAIVWEHNTHIGDASYTDMADDGMTNVGELMRKSYPAKDVVLIGFSTYVGSVIAARYWGAHYEIMQVPPARHGSWDEVLHQAARAEDLLLIFSPDKDSEALLQPRGQRAIGVVYQPEYEQHGNYVPTILPRRYDALLYIDKTEALHPITSIPAKKFPDTYPSGM